MCDTVRASHEDWGVGGNQRENLSAELQDGPKQSEAPYLLLCPWNVCSILHSHTRCHFQHHRLHREQCVIETIWMVYMTESY